MKKSLLFLGIGLLLFVLIGCTIPKPDPTPEDPTEVSIIFNTGTDDVLIETMTGFPGDEATMPVVPNRMGYRFSYWRLNGVEYTFNVFPATTIVLDAVWEQQFTITFETGENGIGLDPIYLYEGNPIPLPTVPSKIGSNQKGYRFDGWLYEGMMMPFETMPQMDLILTAKWIEGVALIFDVDDSLTMVEPYVLTANETIVAPEIAPEKEGYLFMGWSFNGQPFIFDKMPGVTTTLNATWLDLSTTYNSVTTLPKIFINLKNNKPLWDVNREEYVDSSITITNTEEDYELTAISAEFKGRGNGSWVDSGDKKGYRIKFFKKQSLFGEEKSKHWVILASANFNDVSLSKTKMSFDIGKNILDNIEYTTSTNWAEIYVNGLYRGVYTVAEQVRVDEGRVDVESEYGVLDTGYLIEYDNYATGIEGIDYFRIDGFRYPFTMKSPDPEDYIDEGITEAQYRQQVNYIKNFTASALQPAMNKNFSAFAAKADVDSFVDMYILNELFKNTDVGFSSFFMYKKPGEEKLYAGPPWDFDASAGASRGDASPTGIYVADSIRYTNSEFTANYIFINLMQTPEFNLLVRQRWQSISSAIKALVEDTLSEDFITENRFAMGRNFRYWSPQYTNSPTQLQGEDHWVYATRTLRGWLVDRINWLNNHWTVNS